MKTACLLVVIMGMGCTSHGKRAGVAIGAFTAAAGLAVMASSEDDSCDAHDEAENFGCGFAPSSGAMAGGLLLALGATIMIIGAASGGDDQPAPDALYAPPPPEPLPIAAPTSSRFPRRQPPPPPPPVE
jgi:hypothetical protein